MAVENDRPVVYFARTNRSMYYTLFWAEALALHVGPSFVLALKNFWLSGVTFPTFLMAFLFQIVSGEGSIIEPRRNAYK